MKKPATSSILLLSRGDTLGGFRVDEVIGVGGMAIVYRAEQISLGRTVALKVLSGRLSRDSSFRERFRLEGAHAATLEHPNIVPVYDSGEQQGHLYLAMRLITGTSLAERANDRGLTPEQAIELLAPIASALDTAHAAGLIHRDVKPQNILIDSNANPYLADFGVAKGSNTENLTATGGFIGSIGYASPEQIKGLTVTPATDVYALAGVLYFCLTGEVPYARSTDVAVMHAHLTEPPPILEGLLGEALNPVFSRGMAKDPGLRYGHAGDLIAAARQSIYGLPPELRRAAPIPREHARPVDGRTSASRIDRGLDREPTTDGDFGGGRPPRGPSLLQSPTPEDDGAGRRRGSSSRSARRFDPVDLALTSGFAFTQGPLPPESTIPLLGRTSLLDRLVSQLQHSHGGSTLITGMRGVGKTTLIEQATAQLAGSLNATNLLIVKVNVARPRTPEQLLYEVIRRIYEQLSDRNALNQLEPGVRKHLETAYRRTSQTITDTRGETNERKRGMGFRGPLGLQASGSGSTTSASSMEASFLPYGAADVEYDFTRLVESLAPKHIGRPSRFLSRLRRGSRTPWRARIIVIVDELDKLTETSDGKEMLRHLVTSLKNVLTATPVNFVFVAGQDLYDAVSREKHRGNSVYDSIFGGHVYVHCVWRGEEALLAQLVADNDAFGTPQLTWLRGFLAYQGRGIPRLLLKDLSTLVRWNSDGPFLALTPDVLRRLAFYADLQAVVLKFLRDHRDHMSTSNLDRDRWYLSVYYTVDLILRFRDAFTLHDVITSRSRVTDAEFHLLTEAEVQALLACLVSGGFVERIGSESRQARGDTKIDATPVTPHYIIGPRAANGQFDTTSNEAMPVSDAPGDSARLGDFP